MYVSSHIGCGVCLKAPIFSNPSAVAYLYYHRQFDRRLTRREKHWLQDLEYALDNEYDDDEAGILVGLL